MPPPPGPVGPPPGPPGPPPGGPPIDIPGAIQHLAALVAQIVGVTPEEAQRVLTAYLSTLPPPPAPAVVAFLQQGIANPQQAALALAHFVQQQAGPPPGMPPPGAMPPGMPMQGPPPGMGPPVGVPPAPGLPSPVGAPSPLPGGGGSPGTAAPSKGPAKPKPKPPPELPLRPLPKSRWGAKGPGYRELLDRADAAQRRWKSRNERIEDELLLIQGDPVKSRLNWKGLAEATGGDEPYIRAQPALTVQRHIALVAATEGRLWVECRPVARDQKTIDAAQRCQDLLHTLRDTWARRWLRRGEELGDPRMPLPYEEAGLLCSQGALGGQLLPLLPADYPDEPHPLHYEPIPAYELYPDGGATFHIFSLPLAEARERWPKELAKWYPTKPAPDDSSSGRANPAGGEPTDRVTVVAWADATWRAIALKDGPSPAAGESAIRNPQSAIGKPRWLLAPVRHNLGFVPYLYTASPIGTPGTATQANPRDLDKHRGLSVISQNYNTYRHLNDTMADLTYASKKAIWPPGVDYIEEGDDPPKPFASHPGATNTRWVGRKIEFPVTDPASAPSFQALISARLADVQSAAPPPLSGQGPSSSGYEFSQRGDAASQLYVEPLRQTLVEHYTKLGHLTCELVRRLGGEGVGEDGARYDKLRITVHSGPNAGDVAFATPADFKRNGYDRDSGNLAVRYVDDDVTLRMQEAQLHGFLVQHDFESRLSAMRGMRTPNPIMERDEVFYEHAVYDNSQMQKAAMEWGVYGKDDAYFTAAWERARGAQAPPTAPGQPGMTGPPQPPGRPGAPPGSTPQPGGGGLPGILARG